ncbi:MAG TPA: DUF2231 domain-containing protein [Actinomycetota bacterium]|nr:DUF2231 domain-containing protein [Actinomycetota bacterium]
MAGNRYTLKDIVQGKPMGHPSHPMFVHFPIAFYVGALGFDVLSRVGSFESAPLAATWLIAGAALFLPVLLLTGLVDWSGMRPGGRARKMANKHMLLQLSAAALFIVTLILRWPDREIAEAKTMWIALEAVGVVAMGIGNYFGGLLIYKMSMRVGETPPSKTIEEPVAS